MKSDFLGGREVAPDYSIKILVQSKPDDRGHYRKIPVIVQKNKLVLQSCLGYETIDCRTYSDAVFAPLIVNSSSIGIRRLPDSRD